MITYTYGGKDPDTMPIDTHPEPPAPIVGEDVHYVARGSADGKFQPACRAAQITETGDDPARVGVAVLNPTGLFFHPLADGGLVLDEGRDEVSREHPGWRLCGGLCYGPGTWHRPAPR